MGTKYYRDEYKKKEYVHRYSKQPTFKKNC